MNEQVVQFAVSVCKDIDDDDDSGDNNDDNNNNNNTINSRRDDDDDGPNVECEEYSVFSQGLLLLDRFSGVS